MLHIFHSHTTEILLPDKHPFPSQKYALLLERVEQLATTRASTVGSPLTIGHAPAATDEEILRVHTAEYLRRVTHNLLTPAEQRAIGFPWSESFVQRARHSSGATLAAARAVVKEGGWGVHLAGGTHHASADRGQGFCVFNDVAIAVRMLQAEHALRRALIIDTDVHQGNGTAELFAADPSVYTFSIHGARNFPLKKVPSNLDVPLEDGCDDATYLRLLKPAVEQAIRESQPEWVFWISGADPYQEDKYGRMSLTKAGLRRRDQWIACRLRETELPVVTVMGGGYARNVEDIAEIYAATVEELAFQSPLLNR